MDLKALIAKMDHIESKKILNEGFPTVADAKARADKEKTTGKFDKKELSTGTQYTRKSSTFDDGGKDKDQKKAEKKKKNEGIDFQSSIAQMLLKEFGLEEKVTLPANGSSPDIQQVKTPGGTVTQAAPAVKNPYQGADAAKFAAMSPEDQAWLTKGGQQPDINDQFILMRAPNKGKAVAKPATPAAVPADDRNEMDKASDIASSAAAPTKPAASATTATVPADDRNEMDKASDIASSAAAPGAAKPTKPAAPTRPAASAANKSMTPAINAYASRMGLLKNNKPDVEAIKKFQQENGLKADGIIGPNTAGAILSAQKPGAAMGRGGGAAPGTPAGAAPDALAMPPAAAQKTFAQDTAARKAAAQPGAAGSYDIRADIDRFKSKNNMSLQANKDYVARLQAKLDAAAGGQAAQSAAPGKPTQKDIDDRAAQVGAYQAASLRNEDDAILERIRTALFR